MNLVAHGFELEWTVGGNLSEKCWDDLRQINLHWHDLRHEALSRLGESGELSDHELMEIAGHANLTTTQRYLNTRIERLKQGVLRAAAKRQRKNPPPRETLHSRTPPKRHHDVEVHFDFKLTVIVVIRVG